jgi:predicted nucleic acid-binding Zn ribbon protein
MEVTVKHRTVINVSDIYTMRRSGATLQQIASKVDKTKERIRQILVKNYGSTKHKLLSTEQLRKIFGFSRYRILELYQENIIAPVKEWDANNGHYLLWSQSAVERITAYYNTFRPCKMCGSRIPDGRRVFCSEQCYKEGHKYRYKSAEEKQRHMECIRRYRNKCRRSSIVTIESSKREKVLV